MDTEREFFPPAATTTVLIRDLRTAIMQADLLDSVQIEILSYTSLSPWFCFNVGALKYAIWRETGALFEVDEIGAVGDDPISGPHGS